MARQARPSELCGHPDCTTTHKDGHVGPKRASYGWPGGRAERCAEHAEAGMVPGVAFKHCEFPGCVKRASHGAPGTSPLRCGEHQDVGDVDLRARTRCVAPGCGLNASFGPPGGRRMHCVTHKGEGEVSFDHRICAVEGCARRPRWTNQREAHPLQRAPRPGRCRAGAFGPAMRGRGLPEVRILCSAGRRAARSPAVQGARAARVDVRRQGCRAALCGDGAAGAASTTGGAAGAGGGKGTGNAFPPALHLSYDGSRTC